MSVLAKLARPSKRGVVCKHLETPFFYLFKVSEEALGAF